MRQNRPWPTLAFMLGMRTCLLCHIPDRWSRNANRIWPDLAFGFVHKRSGDEIMYLYCDTWNVYFIFCELWRILSFSVETWSIDLRLLSKGRELLCSKPSVRWTSLLKRQPLFLWTKSETCSILSSSGVMDILGALVRNCLRPATVYYKYVQF